MGAEQDVLIEGLPEPEPVRVPPLPLEKLKLRAPNRKQLIWAPMDIDGLLPLDHKARAIWELSAELDLSRFRERMVTTKGDVGRAGWDPRLLVSIWLYALSEGIGSAREIARLMKYEPALIWLSGNDPVNYHTLSDFRSQHREALDDLFSQMLALLAEEGLVRLELVAHDGTKVAAQAGADSFRREPTVRERLEQARQWVERLAQGETQDANPRRQAAQLRAARERQQRMEEALRELQALQAEKEDGEEKQKARVSVTEPEARIMKHGDQAFGPAYNLQLSSDGHSDVVIGVELTQCSADAPALPAALDQIQRRMEEMPARVAADGGFISRENIQAAEQRGIDLVGPVPDSSQQAAAVLQAAGIAPEFYPGEFVAVEGSDALRCPAGKLLPYARPSKKKRGLYRQYQAAAEDCTGCPLAAKCCPKSKSRGKGRTVSVLVKEEPAMAAFRKKMEQPEAQQAYRRRGQLAEFPNAWIKDKIGLRKFRLRGLAKAKAEALWACLSYDVGVWIRKVWRRNLAAAAA